MLAALGWSWVSDFVDISSNIIENGPSNFRVTNGSTTFNTFTRNTKKNPSKRPSKQQKDQETKQILIELDATLEDTQWIWRLIGKNMKGGDRGKIWLMYSYFPLCGGRIFVHLQKLMFLNKNISRFESLMKNSHPLAHHYYSCGYARQMSKAAVIVLTLWKNGEVSIFRQIMQPSYLPIKALSKYYQEVFYQTIKRF